MRSAFVESTCARTASNRIHAARHAPDDRPQCLHAGPVLSQDGDYYGQTVNVASRIATYARPGEVLVSQTVVDASDGVPVAFTDLGLVELKGVSEALHLHAASRG